MNHSALITAPNGNTYEFGRSAELRAWREYMGLSQRSLGELLNIRERTIRSFEAGRDPIPTALWEEVQTLVGAFDEEVEQLLEKVEAHQQNNPCQTLTVLVPRVDQRGQRPAGWLRQVVAVVMAQTRAVVPRYEDDLDLSHAEWRE